ncbi:GNAT family N-acetyltransferase [Pseudohoeflea coraliihabitans]|uniref:GNAT family N-acetyltransferase n=1 Tax=Pseudohoeflea coraliihabitans TaxID=2860393 RepID=A0ABS6WS40_9HYPH|nr:GNAT family N-acetyltransferase [Pseudohoeflea sp. DP4N28-3]MBW3098784.1 GNAT family N-acetyltransferase [Pseudohoeflea sp. DP4N28-3]
MQAVQENSLSHSIASRQSATRDRNETSPPVPAAAAPGEETAGSERSRLHRAASMVSVTNRVRAEDIPRLLEAAGNVIGQLASTETVLRIADINPDSIHVFSRRGRARAEGFVSTLLLNRKGRTALLDGTLNLLDPQSEYLVRQHESPDVIYVWASYTPGLLAAGIERVFDRYDSPHYARADIISTSFTLRGHRAMVNRGFEKGIEHDGRILDQFYILPRSPQTVKTRSPRYATYHPELQPTGIRVVNGFDDMMRMAAVRSAVFIGEQACPYDEEFDGNDLAATHLLAFVDNEPAGCMRIRFFGDFAKMERLAVRKQFRHTRTAFDLVRASVDICRDKGYRRLYGHAREDYLHFWQHFGFHVKENGAPFSFSDHAFVEMLEDIEPSRNAVKLADGPYRIIRPEGAWHVPGPLERSAERGAA